MYFTTVMSLALIGFGAEPAADAGQRAEAVYARAIVDWQALAAQGVRIAFVKELAFNPDGDKSTRGVEAGVAKYLGNWTREDFSTEYDRRAIAEQTALLFDGGVMKSLVTYVPSVFAAGSASGPLSSDGVIKRYGVIKAGLDQRMTADLTSENVALTLLHPDEWLIRFGGINRGIVERRRREGKMADLMTHAESTDQGWTVLTSRYADPRLHWRGGTIEVVRQVFLDPQTGLPTKVMVQGSGKNAVCELSWDTIQLLQGGSAAVLTWAMVSYPEVKQPAMSHEYRYLAHEVRVGDVDPADFSLEFPEGMHVIDRVNIPANASNETSRPQDRVQAVARAFAEDAITPAAKSAAPAVAEAPLSTTWKLGGSAAVAALMMLASTLYASKHRRATRGGR